MINLNAKTYTIGLLTSLLTVATSCTPAPPSGNQAPSAEAGEAQDVSGGMQVTLDGSGSSDPDGDELTFAWSQTSGSSVILSDANTATPSFVTPNADGTLRFALEVTDPSGATSVDTVNITVTAVDDLPPTSRAGTDQSVGALEDVTLNGSGSSDAEGDITSFSWTQVEGTPVQITDADMAMATFVAPNVNETLVFELTVTDDAEQTGTDRVDVAIIGIANVLFVANFGGNSVVSYADPESLTDAEPVQPTTMLVGPNTGFNETSDITITDTEALIVSNAGANSLSLYTPVREVTGDDDPTLVVQGPSTGLSRPNDVAHEATNDIVFVLNTGNNNDILLFLGPGEQIFGGDLAPLRTVTSEAIDAATGMVLDGSGNLYVANNGAGNVVVFDDLLNSESDEPTRTITNADFTDLSDVFVDASDNMYVTLSTGEVLRFADASDLNGDAAPDATIEVAGSTLLSAVVVSSADVGFVVDVDGNAIYQLNNISTLNGMTTPDFTIEGDDSGLDLPVSAYLWEAQP